MNGTRMLSPGSSVRRSRPKRSRMPARACGTIRIDRENANNGKTTNTTATISAAMQAPLADIDHERRRALDLDDLDLLARGRSLVSSPTNAVHTSPRDPHDSKALVVRDALEDERCWPISAAGAGPNRGGGAGGNGRSGAARQRGSQRCHEERPRADMPALARRSRPRGRGKHRPQRERGKEQAARVHLASGELGYHRPQKPSPSARLSRMPEHARQNGLAAAARGTQAIRARANSSASNGRRSSSCSPTPMSLTGMLQLARDRQRDTAFRGAVELGQDEAGRRWTASREQPRLAQTVLAGRGSSESERLVRRVRQLAPRSPAGPC